METASTSVRRLRKNKMDIRTGFGYDIHTLKKGNGMTLGGVMVQSEYSIVAHSDGDLVFHALAQAIFASLSMEDIGTYFPDTSNTTEGMDSSLLVRRALDEMKKRGYSFGNVVIDIVTEVPKLKPYKAMIKKSVSKLLSLDIDRIAVHANTSEKVGPVGEKKAIECYCQLLIIG